MDSLKKELQPESSKSYLDPETKLPTTKILPGEFHIANGEEMIVTTLGSCICACIRDKELGIGGMNHFMLPHEKSSHHIDRKATAYGQYAMEHLINEILKKNQYNRKNLEAKIFGGGAVVDSNISVGDENIRFVKTYLKLEGIPILAEDLGEDVARKIYFQPATGKVTCKRFQAMNNRMIEEREKAYLENIEQRIETEDTEVELFS